MTYLIIILAILLGVIGIIGAIMPGLPGTPLSYLGILALIFLPNYPINLTYLIVMGIITIAITILDYVIPIIGTKKFYSRLKSNIRVRISIIRVEENGR